jgi:formylglycine-generating enzyme required for sulfatase activity
VAEALHHAHTRGITHRDLKPSNILLDAEGKAQLADFGLLRTFLNDTIVDASQPQLEGTVPYMSPAVAAGKAEDTRCDIYAFGCLLYEMLTGQPPYQGPTVDAVLKQIQDGPPPPIRQLNPQAPAALTAIADHAMARELRDRYASMADVVAELERVAQGKTPIGTHGREKESPGKRKAMVAAGIVALVGLAAYGIARLPFWKSDGTRPVTATAPPATATVPAVVERKPGEENVINLPNGVTMKLVWIPATTSEAWNKLSDGKDYFVMGSPPDEPGCDAKEEQVRLKLSQGFWMAQTECTQKQWIAVMGGNPSGFKGDDMPVENVSWHDAQEFITKLNEAKTLPAGWKAALPTEAQWEYACRAGTKTAYHFGETISAKQANSGDSNDRKICAVASYPANAWGLHDMHGNVCEWCADWIADKLPGGTDPPGATSGEARLLRGGACGSAPYECRAARRDAYLPVGSTCVWGFRLAVNPPPAGVLAQGPFSYTATDGAVTIVKYTGSGGDLVIHDQINGQPVTAIGAGAFKDCTKLTGVTIPATVTGLAKEAFSGCTGLRQRQIQRQRARRRCGSVAVLRSDQANIYYLPGTTGWGKEFAGRPALLQLQDYNCVNR